MKWLTLDYIKQHSRIDMDCEDAVLELYAESAEETVLDTIGRTLVNVVLKYDGVPARLVHASLMLVDMSYQHRAPVTQANMSVVPYAFDLMVKPFVRLASGSEEGYPDTLPDGAVLTSDGLLLVDSQNMIVTLKSINGMEIKGTVQIPYSGAELSALLGKVQQLPTAAWVQEAIDGKQDKLEFASDEDVERYFGGDGTATQ